MKYKMLSKEKLSRTGGKETTIQHCISKLSIQMFIKRKIRAGKTCIYLLKVGNRNTRTRCEICSKLKIKTPERHHWHLSGIFILNFEHISHLVLVFLLLTLNI